MVSWVGWMFAVGGDGGCCAVDFAVFGFGGLFVDADGGICYMWFWVT